MDEVRQIIEALKEYRAELIHKNYPMGKINELIIKWEDWLNTPQEERFRQRALAEEQALEEYSKQAQMDDKSVSDLLQEGFEEELKQQQQEDSHNQSAFKGSA